MDYVSFQQAKKEYLANITPEMKAFRLEQVKRRTLAFLDAIDKKDLKGMLATRWGIETPFDEVEAWLQAQELGYSVTSLNYNPEYWYKLLKPVAKRLAKSSLAFTCRFEKL